MARFSGVVGYESEPKLVDGIATTSYDERQMRGDVLNYTQQMEPSQTAYDDVTLSNRISIVGDKYAFLHCSQIRYVVFEGQKWKVTSMTVARPRIILSVGGIWNGA